MLVMTTERKKGGRREPGLPEPISVVKPAEPDSIGPLRHRAAEFAAASGAGKEVVADVMLAVSEAATNVVKYAYESRGEGEVELSAAVKNGWLEIGVGDNGREWFEGESDGLGLGVTIIARLCESLRIVQEGAGTKVQMRFALPSRGG
jgi:serine/threonine-protein kinase RsbW